jgi:hypothetical protein
MSTSTLVLDPSRTVGRGRAARRGRSPETTAAGPFPSGWYLLPAGSPGQRAEWMRGFPMGCRPPRRTITEEQAYRAVPASTVTPAVHPRLVGVRFPHTTPVAARYAHVGNEREAAGT